MQINPKYITGLVYLAMFMFIYVYVRVFTVSDELLCIYTELFDCQTCERDVFRIQ